MSDRTQDEPDYGNPDWYANHPDINVRHAFSVGYRKGFSAGQDDEAGDERDDAENVAGRRAVLGAWSLHDDYVRTVSSR